MFLRCSLNDPVSGREDPVDHSTLAAELHFRHVQRLAKVEGSHELFDRAAEKSAPHPAGPHPAIVAERAGHAEELRDLGSKKDARQQHLAPTRITIWPTVTSCYAAAGQHAADSGYADLALWV